MDIHDFIKYESTHDKLNDIINQNFELIRQFCYVGDTNPNSPSPEAFVSNWYPCKGCVEIYWEESWNYGGYANGYCSIEATFLLDIPKLEKELEIRKAAHEENLKDTVRKMKEIQDAAEIETLKRLNDKHKIF